ncbi:zinc metalloprotease [Ekhidna sp.]
MGRIKSKSTTIITRLTKNSSKLFAISFLFLIVTFIFENNPKQEREVLRYPRIPAGKFYMCPAGKHFALADAKMCMTSLHNVLGDSSLPNVDKKFLFVVHITTDSLGQTIFDRGSVTEAGIKNAIRAAGGFYSRIGIEFEAEDSIYVLENPRFDKMGSTDELEENAKLNAKQNRINLFIIDSFDKDLEGAAGIAGSNYMHIASGSANAGTIAHETGHIFSLEHTFGTGDVLAAAAGEPFTSTDELVDGSNCGTAGDFVCDTPADPYIFPSGDETEPVTYFENCIFVYDSVDAKGFYYDPQPGNIMSYYSSTDCPCSSFLTDGQLKRVADKYYTDGENFSWW